MERRRKAETKGVTEARHRKTSSPTSQFNEANNGDDKAVAGSERRGTERREGRREEGTEGVVGDGG